MSDIKEKATSKEPEPLDLMSQPGVPELLESIRKESADAAKPWFEKLDSYLMNMVVLEERTKTAKRLLMELAGMYYAKEELFWCDVKRQLVAKYGLEEFYHRMQLSSAATIFPWAPHFRIMNQFIDFNKDYPDVVRIRNEKAAKQKPANGRD